MAFKEVEPSIWGYVAAGDFCQGVLVDKKLDLGKFNANLYTIETEPGVFQSIWGSAILDERMTLIRVGDKIRVTYKGLGEAKEDQNPPKIFSVEVDRD